jgi:DNA-directed RNA polymerase subunit M/transcription elongation factor TFIIS
LSSESPASQDNISSEVIYLRYDDKHMKYIYLCSKCNTTWKTSDKK